MKNFIILIIALITLQSQAQIKSIKDTKTQHSFTVDYNYIQVYSLQGNDWVLAVEKPVAGRVIYNYNEQHVNKVFIDNDHFMLTGVHDVKPEDEEGIISFQAMWGYDKAYCVKNIRSFGIVVSDKMFILSR